MDALEIGILGFNRKFGWTDCTRQYQHVERRSFTQRSPVSLVDLDGEKMCQSAGNSFVAAGQKIESERNPAGISSKRIEHFMKIQIAPFVLLNHAGFNPSLGNTGE